MPKPILLYVKYVDFASEKVGRMAMLLIFMMIGVLLLDAVTRNVLRIPLSKLSRGVHPSSDCNLCESMA